MTMSFGLLMGLGKSRLKLKKRVWNGLNVDSKDKVKIYGKLDNEVFEKAELDVLRVEKQNNYL
ncbi:putative outer membrane protein [Haemophilus influenzae]|uniref:Putative outer membrane protein n=1 Tax=Haemophilus influenzae TaxID=727 RepID=A0A2X1PHW7_HAEIF|nr:putative outer membrane protein [Haemophilus influenzae]